MQYLYLMDIPHLQLLFNWSIYCLKAGLFLCLNVSFHFWQELPELRDFTAQFFYLLAVFHSFIPHNSQRGPKLGFISGFYLMKRGVKFKAFVILHLNYDTVNRGFNWLKFPCNENSTVAKYQQNFIWIHKVLCKPYCSL